MTTKYMAFDWAQKWHDFWRGEIGEWIITRGLRIVLLVLAAILVARFINWAAQKITRRIDADFQESDQLVRSESAKHRQAVASVISWVSIALLFVVVPCEITDILAIPVGSLVAPAAVLGAALGFGAQRIVQDLLSGFFIITEKQYGFGDLVELTISGVADDARGHGRGRHAAGHQAALHRGRDVHHPQRPDRQVDEPVQGLGARGRRHPGADDRRPQQGQRGPARRLRERRWRTRACGPLLLDAPR